MVAVGPLAQVELTRENGQLIEVSIPRESLRQLGLTEGDAVQLYPRRVRVFEASLQAA